MQMVQWVLTLDSFTHVRPLFSHGFSTHTKKKHSIVNDLAQLNFLISIHFTISVMADIMAASNVKICR